VAFLVVAVPFGRQAQNEREGGYACEPGVRCVECRSKWALVVVAPGVYHCDGDCVPDWMKFDVRAK
jgi:hypothetical protein